MNKLLVSLGFLFLFYSPAHAQMRFSGSRDVASERPSHPVYVAIHGSTLFSLNENAHSYIAHERIPDLLSMQCGAQLGYYFTNNLSARMAFAYGSNKSACNSLETHGGFYPYKFKSINMFVDLVYDFMSRDDNLTNRVFYPGVYGGVGYARSFGFEDSGHPWQKVSPLNNVFGFRFGVIGEFTITRKISLFVDLCAEGYGDQYNGLQPSNEDQDLFDGYGGLPYDMRFVASFGLLFHL